MKGFGLVFSGGGGKGAYEVGVWKYLHELGLDNYIRAVSGTSVGALNAALFAGSSYDKAENMWLSINKSKILSPRKVSSEEISQWLSKAGLNAGFLTMGVSNVASAGLFSLTALSEYLLVNTKGEYFFSRDGLTEMIKECIDFDLLQNNDIPCFVTCLRYPEFKTERFKINEYSIDEIITLLLASSAIPLIFSKEEFRGKKYYDGGFPIGGDNTPIQPVYETGVENIIVVHLNRETIIDRSLYPGTNIIEIVPSEELGNTINGTLDFSASGAKQRIDVGYEDAQKVLQPMLEMLILSFKNQISLEQLKKHLDQFEKDRIALIAKETAIKEEITNDEFENICQELTKEE